MKLRYSLKNGHITGIGYFAFEFEVDENTPFKTIEESQFWRKEDDKWVKYDPTWIFEQFNVRVTIPESIILDNPTYLGLRDLVLQLKSEGRAEMLTAENNRVMYFIQLLPEHEKLLKSDINVKIEKK